MDEMRSTELRRHHRQSQIQSHSNRQLQKPIRTGTWFPAEDARLQEAVAKHGPRWVSVAAEVGTRSGDQCAKRWNEKLNPELDHSPWTSEEEERLLDLVETYGHNWKFMADSFLEARAPLALKNRYSLLMRRMKRQQNKQQRDDWTSGTRSSKQPTIHNHPSGKLSPTLSTPRNPDECIDAGGTSRKPDVAFSVINNTISMKDFPIPTTAFEPLIMDACGTMAPMYQGSESGSGSIISQNTSPLNSNSTWANQDILWQQQQQQQQQQQPSLLSNDMDLDKITSYMERNRISESNLGNQNFHQQGSRPVSPPNATTSKPSNADDVHDSNLIEYTVTCQKSKLKKLINHLMDAAMAESTAWAAGDEQLTLSLKLSGPSSEKRCPYTLE